MIKKITLAAFVAAMSAGAASASTVTATGISTDGGTTFNYVGTATSDRTMSGNALGSPDGFFYSIGLGGEAIFDFGTLFNSPGSVVEITNGSRSSYPESADIYVSTDGSTYSLATSVNNATATNAFSFSVAGGPFQYLKVVDTSGAPSTDGYDIDSISVSAVPLPATGLLLLGGLGGIAALKRRKKAA